MKRTSNPAELAEIAKTIRRHIITMIGAAKSGHPGGSLSAVEILVTLYCDVMRHDPANPKWPDRDRFILSKGHAAPVLYAVMAECGYTPVDQLNTLRKLGSIYQGHPDLRFMPGLEASTGSLGQGLSLALGMGSAARLDGASWRTYVVLGDGEIQEGQIWEAAMFGAFHKVDNVVRHRRLQPHPARRLRQGHHGTGAARRQVARLRLARHRDRRPRHRGAASAPSPKPPPPRASPPCIIAHTIKGKGVSLHGEQSQVPRRRPPRPKKCEQALQGACHDMAANTKFELKTGTGHARGVRPRAGGTRPREPGHRGLRRRSLEVHHDAVLRQGVPGPLLRVRHRRSQHGRPSAPDWPSAGKIPFVVQLLRASVVNKGFEQLRVTRRLSATST